MTFKAATVNALILSLGGAAAFSSSQIPSAFVPRGVARTQATTTASLWTAAHGSGCPCCSSRHSAACACTACSGRRSLTMLFSEPEAAAAEAAPVEVVEEEVVAEVAEVPVVEAAEAPVVEEAVVAAAATPEVPAAVASLDGVESAEEAHNVDRPARKALKKKAKGKALADFAVGDSVAAKVKTITSYGAFLDIGASTDGLLHISQLATEFVADVSSVLSVGQEVQVRITGIDEGRNQVALTLLTADQEEEAKAAAGSRPARAPRGERRDDASAINGLSSKGWKTEQFIEGTVVSTVDFGAFVRINVNQLNAECEGEIDGLVHISALSAGRAASVTDFVKVDDKVQVRLKAIGERNKVSLTMVSVEDEAAKREQGGGGSGPEPVGNREWREAVKAMEQPTFSNGPVVVDMRA